MDVPLSFFALNTILRNMWLHLGLTLGIINKTRVNFLIVTTRSQTVPPKLLATFALLALPPILNLL